MATIGTFTKTDNGYTGSVKTLALNVKARIVRRQLNIQPTLTIRPGFPVRVIVTKDLIFSGSYGG